MDAPFWCLHHGERELAVTLHYMTERLDEGPTIDQRRSRIPATRGVIWWAARDSNPGPSG